MLSVYVRLIGAGVGADNRSGGSSGRLLGNFTHSRGANEGNGHEFERVSNFSTPRDMRHRRQAEVGPIHAGGTP